MKEYLRIMFSNFDIMDHKDWDLWRTYSNRTFNIVFAINFLVWSIALLIVFFKTY